MIGEQERTPTFWAAPELIDAGYRVFPVDKKAPTVEGGFYGATKDKSQVAAWIEAGRGDHDIAVPTGVFCELAAIDADTPETFEEMKAKHGQPTYTTKRGGHWLFQHPHNGKVVSSKVKAGLDRKGDGGYVIFPPSKGREWTNGIPRVEDLPTLPQEFWSKTKGPTPGERTIAQERKDAAAAVIAGYVKNINQGGRHTHLVHLCGVMLGRNVSLVDAEDILKAAWGKVGGDLAARAGDEIPNTLNTTQQAIKEDRATGVPSMEKITPGLFDELAEALGWIRKMRTGSRKADSSDSSDSFSKGAEDPPGQKPPPVADRLVHYARAAGWPLFVDQHSEAHTFVDGQAVPVSRTNRPLTRLLHEHEERAPSNDGLIGARRVLDMLAHDSGEVRELHTRAAFHEDAVFYELAAGRVVRINADGWKLDDNPPAYFRAVKNLQPLPDPARGGRLEEIAKWVNLKTDRDRRLYLSYVTLAALPHIPRPILQTTGVMGSGKTTASRLVKRLLDPTGNEAVTIDRRDFLQKAAHCYVLMLDNQTSLPEWFQDTLCRLVTGESDSKRVLYTDEEDLVWSMQRAVLLNGINPPSDRGDVQDRTLPIELDRLDNRERLPEDDFWMQFSLKHPELLGAVFDALSGALRERPTVKLTERPRLADWGLYAAALYESQGWGVDAFVEDWQGVEEAQQQGTLDGSIVAQAVILYMKDHDRVELPPGKLHAALESRAADDLYLGSDKTWPKTGRTLWNKIREVTPLLETHGIRAYRSSSNKTGRPIILDTEFTDPDEPKGAKYAKYGDDKGDDNFAGDDKGDDNFRASSPHNADTYQDGDDNGAGGRYFGDTLAFNTSDSKEDKETKAPETTQGESIPDLSSPLSPSSAIADSRLLSNLRRTRPDWLTKQAAACLRRGASSSLLQALAVAVAHQALNNPRRADEVLTFVRDNLKELAG